MISISNRLSEARARPRLLVEKAAEYCRKQGMQSLAVTCSDVDLELYRALGFTTRLGTNLTMPLPYES